MQDAPPAPDAPTRTETGPQSFHLHGLHVDLHGPEDAAAPPLLLIHGFMASRAQWHGNLARLSRRRWVAVVELLGHGRSHAPDDPEAYEIPRYVEALVDLEGGHSINAEQPEGFDAALEAFLDRHPGP